MNKLRVIGILALALAMAGCGSNSSTGSANNINGAWMASLTNTDGTTAFGFAANFTQASGSSVTVTNFTITSPSPCFPTTTTETGTFGLMGSSNGNVTGTFGMTVSTMFPAATNNVLTLTGAVNGKTITGTWTLTGLTGCSGNGSFTIIQPSTGS
jgi:hypothetical protein